VSVEISDLIKAIFNCKDIADARTADLERVIAHGGRVDPDLSYEQNEREKRFKVLLDRYIDERIKIAVESDQRTIHDVSRSPLDVADCGTHVRPAAKE
jgi:hypothetical protein